MLGARQEQHIPQVYTARKMGEILRNYTRKGIQPPDEIVQESSGDYNLAFKSWKEITAINTVNRAKRKQIRLERAATRTRFEPVRVLERARNVLASAGVVFSASVHR